MRMTHPEINGDGHCVSVAQFEAVYAPNGWELADEDAPMPHGPTAHVAPFDPQAGRHQVDELDPNDEDLSAVAESDGVVFTLPATTDATPVADPQES